MEKPYKLLYPMRIVLITSSYKGKDNVMSAAWCFPLSSEPSLFGVCLSKKRYSHELISASKEFAINVPGEDLRDAAMLCGRNSGREKDKFMLAKLTKEHGKLAVPLIKECLSSIECKVVDEREYGDHVLFVGQAVNVLVRKQGKGIYHMGGDEIMLL